MGDKRLIDNFIRLCFGPSCSVEEVGELSNNHTQTGDGADVPSVYFLCAVGGIVWLYYSGCEDCEFLSLYDPGVTQVIGEIVILRGVVTVHCMSVN